MRVLRPVLAAAAALALAAAGTVLVAAPAAAADGVVTSTADDNSIGTLRYEIDNSSSGDVITFDPAVFGTAQTITLDATLGEIYIDHTLTVQGPGSSLLTVTRGADLSNYNMFSAIPTAVADITVSGLTISRVPSVTETGAAFLAADDEIRDLTFTDVVFENQAAEYGAGLYVQDISGDLAIGSSAFRDNASSQNGGGVWADGVGGGVTITNSTFDTNSAGSDGAGVYLEDVGAILVQVSVFTGNRSGGNGGAFAVVRADSAYVSGSEFGSIDDATQGNTADLRGGALYLEQIDGPVDIVENGFDDNAALGDSDTADGGAIHVDEAGSVGIAASHFRNNRAFDEGGAVYLEDLTMDATVTVFASHFEENIARVGGALHLPAVTVSALLLDSTFVGNQAPEGAGAVFVAEVETDANLTVRGSNFEGNSTSLTDADGAAILVGVNSEVIEIDSSTFFDQVAVEGNGLSLYLGTNNGALRVLNATFDEHADDDSSAVNIDAQGELGRTDILSSTLVGAWRPFEVGANRGVTVLVNSIFSAPAGVAAVATGGEEIDATSSLFSSEYDSGVITSAATNRFSIADMKLGVLAANGGATLTRLPLVGSPARDAGDSDATYVATTPNDQRGDGFPRLIGGAIDIGAVEVQPVLAATGRGDLTAYAALGAFVLLFGAAALGYRRVMARRS